jgi:hypothetical protein
MSDQLPEPGEAHEYPRQELLPQDVRPRRSRTPLVIGIVAILVLAAGAGCAYLLLRDDGEGTRAAYCDQLRELTADGDLDAAAAAATGAELSSQLQQLIDDAPNSVADDWQKLRDLGESVSADGDVDLSAALDAMTSLRAIAKDAQDKCDLPIDLPSLGGL